MSVWLDPLAAEDFVRWGEDSRRGFVEQQAASCSASVAQSSMRAEREFTRNLPEGLFTPGHHIWTVRDLDDTGLGHLWIRVDQRSDGLSAFVMDIALQTHARGRGLGRATMLAAEDAVRKMGVSRLGLNVFGHNTVARHLYDSLGFAVASVMMARSLAAGHRAYDERALVLEPMTPQQFALYRPRAESDYANATAASWGLAPQDARRKAADDFAALLPRGRGTPGHSFWIGRHGDLEVGTAWLHVASETDGLQAHGQELTIRHDMRRRGYGRAMLLALERECMGQGALSMTTSLFASQPAARCLLEVLGFSSTAQLMTKPL